MHLYQKMKDLDGKFLATGHYAKLFHHQAHDTYYVHTSNDEENDQSALLSRLPSEVLKRLMLPLSDLTKKEVLKLAENFGLTVRESKLKMFQCFPTNEKTVEFLSGRVPKGMVAPGEMYNKDGTEMFGEHLGVLWYDYGEPVKLAVPTKKEDFFLASYNMKDKRLSVAEEESFKHACAQLVECEFSEEVSWVEPMKAVIRLPGDNYVDCWVHPKSQRTAFVEWEGDQLVKAGEILSVMRRKGKNSKVYLTGKVRYVPRKEAPAEDNMGEEKVPETDYTRDF
jgi:tRNA-specific 2-thiouridylase